MKFDTQDAFLLGYFYARNRKINVHDLERYDKAFTHLKHCLTQQMRAHFEDGFNECALEYSTKEVQEQPNRT